MKRGSDQTEQVGVGGLATIAEVKQAEESGIGRRYPGAVKLDRGRLYKAQYGRCESEQLKVNM